MEIDQTMCDALLGRLFLKCDSFDLDQVLSNLVNDGGEVNVGPRLEKVANAKQEE